MRVASGLVLGLTIMALVRTEPCALAQQSGGIGQRGKAIGASYRPELEGAKGDEVTDDSTALTQACSQAKIGGTLLRLGQVYRMTESMVLGCDVEVGPGAQLKVDSGATVMIKGRVHAEPTQQVFAGAGTVVAATAPWVSVAWWGALAAANSGTDARPGIQAAVGANRTIYFPPATYMLKSFAASRIYPLVSGQQGVQILGVADAHLTNLTLEGAGATITADAPHGNSNWIAVDYVDHFKAHGFNFSAVPAAWPANSEPTAFFMVHVTDFELDIRMTGNWGGSSRHPFAIAGNWLSDGYVRMAAPAISGCLDLAFLRRVRLEIHATGADDSGSMAHASQVACVNVEYDANFANNYPAAVAFAKTTQVTIERASDISNFSAGAFLRAGGPYSIMGHLHDNPAGDSMLTNTAGAGIILFNETASCCPSQPDPVHDVTVAADLSRNGANAAGAGLLIDASHVTGSEKITNITVGGSKFDNNTNTGIKTVGPANVSTLALGANTYTGANQTTAIDANTRLLLTMSPRH